MLRQASLQYGIFCGIDTGFFQAASFSAARILYVISCVPNVHAEFNRYTLLFDNRVKTSEVPKMCHNNYMNEKQTLRPSKKQRELLTFIENFINQHGYSPSYREIMSGLNYTSVATVSLHVSNLIKRGHLQKRDRSARSLEVVKTVKADATNVTSNKIEPGQEKWLVEKVEHAFQQVENSGEELVNSSLDNLYILVGSLKVLGLEGAAQSFTPRLAALKQRSN